MHFSLKDHSKQILLLLSLSLVRGLIYVAIVPPWQAPDEPRHFEYVRLLYEKRRWLTWSDATVPLQQEIITSMNQHRFWEFGFTSAGVFKLEPGTLPQTFREIWSPEITHELHQPPIGYVPYAAVMPLVVKHDTVVQLYAMRLISVLVAMCVVLVAFFTAKELFPGEEGFMPLAVPVFVVFLPMHTFITSSLTNDPLAELVVSLVVLLVVRTFRRGLSLSRMGATLSLLILGLLTKRTTLVVIPTLVGATLLYFWEGILSLTRHWKRMSLILIAVIIVIGRGIQLWDRLTATMVRGFPGLTGFVDWMLHFHLLLPSEQFPFSLSRQYVSSAAFALYQRYGQVLFESFWGNFGWMKVRLDTALYVLLAFVSLTAFLGVCHLAIRSLRKNRSWAPWQKQCLWVFLLAVFSAISLTFGNSIRTWNLGWGVLPQGRHLFPVMIPIAILFSFGLRELVPARYEGLFALLYVLFLILLDSICLIAYILPFFYG